MERRLPTGEKWKIFFYLGVLVFLLNFASPFSSLIDVPLTFLLKNKLNLPAHETAEFHLVVGIPLFLSFVFGFLRDRWDLFGMKDRGMLVFFGFITALLYFLAALIPMTYFMLLLTFLLLTIAFQFVYAAQQGLSSLIGQQQLLSGQISAIGNIFFMLPVIIGFLVGGKLSEGLEAVTFNQEIAVLLCLGGVLMAIIAVFAIWKPRAVFTHIDYSQECVGKPWEDIRRLAKHQPIYPALAIWFLWQFAPGAITPLQYHLQNTLGASDAAWGYYNAISNVCVIPPTLLFGYLCRDLPLKKLLFWGTLIAIPQLVPLLFIHSLEWAYFGGALIGLLGAFASSSYLSLIIRSCPSGLQGTTLMMAASFSFLAIRAGDLFGTFLYEQSGGFSSCVWATTLTYLLILPLQLWIPPSLISQADEEIKI